MNIHLIFHPPAGSGSTVGFMQQLTEAQIGLVPNIGDEVRYAGNRWKITRKCFVFHPTTQITEIEFATDLSE